MADEVMGYWSRHAAGGRWRAAPRPMTVFWAHHRNASGPPFQWTARPCLCSPRPPVAPLAKIYAKRAGARVLARSARARRAGSQQTQQQADDQPSGRGKLACHCGVTGDSAPQWRLNGRSAW